MTKIEMRGVIEMAREVKMPYDYVTGEPLYLEKLEAFANLVRADEREACAKVCDDWPNGRDDVYSIGEAIRARSNT